MFSKFFKSNKEECFICCSKDGKTDSEKLFEIMYNYKSMDYPLLSLSSAYNCKCFYNYAHNKCLITINKCPTCRKLLKPKLYINTKFDYYLGFLLSWIKKDISRIEKINWCALSYLIIFHIILFLFNKNIIKIIIKFIKYILLYLKIILSILYILSLCVIIILNDYFNKYWLYNSKIKICCVLNN